MRGNTITVNFGQGRTAHAGSLFQYDKGQRLVIEGVDLPPSYQVHFSNDERGISKTVLGDSTGAEIPDEFLESGESVYVWVYVTGEDHSETEYHGVIRVVKRAEPTDITPAPSQRTLVEQAVTALNNAVENVGNEIETALSAAKESGEFDGAVFTPNVTAQGVISWTNDGGLENPETVNLGDTFAKVADIPDISGKQDRLTFDNVPKQNSANPVTSGGVYTALSVKQDTLTFDNTPTQNSTNPVTSGGVYNALSDIQTMQIHICTSGEYDVEFNRPTIQNPDAKTFYLVPGGDSPNLYIEWVYLNGAWEQFGSATIDLSGYALKSDTILGTTLSRGRKSGTTVGTGSFAFGDDVTASGSYAHAEGINTTASGTASHAEGDGTTALGTAAHAQGEKTTAHPYQHVFGRLNAICLYTDHWPEWEAGKSYAVGDRALIVEQDTHGSPYQRIWAYYCIEANSDAEFTPSKWREWTGASVAEVVGNGMRTDDTTKSNARVLDWEGNEYLAGDVYVHAESDGHGGTKLAKVTDIPSVPVTDVQVNGTSVLSSGVANVPVGSSNTFGVFKTSMIYGIQQDNGVLKTKKATIDIIKAGNDSYNPITTSVQHESVFYGLAKAAGDATQSASDNAVGTYTSEAKAAIRTMLGVPATTDIPTVSVQDVQVNGASVIDSNGNAVLQLPTEETANELLTAETYNAGLTDTTLAVIGMLFDNLPQDSTLTDILHSLELECERLDIIYDEWIDERSAS